MTKEFRVVLKEKPEHAGKMSRLAWVIKTVLIDNLRMWDVESVTEVLKEDNPNVLAQEPLTPLNHTICEHCGAKYWWHSDGKCHDGQEFKEKA